MPLPCVIFSYSYHVRSRLRQKFYKILLNIFNLNVDHKGKNRFELGVSPYARRSPLLMAIYNIRELNTFIRDKSDARFFKVETRALQNSKGNLEALVLGNGPSLAKLNSEQVSLANPDIWVVNDFYKIKQAANLSVTHYVLSDGAYFAGLPNEINSKLKPVLDYAQSKNAILILPHWAKDLKISRVTPLKIFYYDDRGLSAWSKNTTPVKPRGYLGLTLYKGLGFALYLGYKKIFVLGMDNTEFLNYRSDEDNRLLHYDNHAYQDSSIAYDMSNLYLDGMASAFSSLSHNFGDLLKFKGPIVNLDGRSLTTRFPKEANHPWVS